MEQDWRLEVCVAHFAKRIKCVYLHSYQILQIDQKCCYEWTILKWNETPAICS